MSTSATDLELALSGIDPIHRSKLIDAYISVKRSFVQGQYDACGLRAGKFCEVVLRLLQKEIFGASIPYSSKIPNFADECRKLEKSSQSSAPESLRVIIPRAIDFVYTLRNKRDIGHVGGDVDANETDAALCTRALDWCIAELIRIYHKLSLEEAQELIDNLAVRQIPIVWQNGSAKRVLQTGMTLKAETLCLLYSDPHSAVPLEDLAMWIEVRRPAEYKTRVLLPMHKDRLIEYDGETETVMLTPTGAEEAELLIRQRIHGL